MGDFLTVQGHLPTRGSAWDAPLCPCLSAGHFSLLNPGSKARAWLDQELGLERRENDCFGNCLLHLLCAWPEWGASLQHNFPGLHLLVGPFLDGNLAITILSVYITQSSYPTSGNLSSIKSCPTCSFSWKGLCKEVHWSTLCKLVTKTQKFQCPVLPEKWQNKSWFMYSWEVINNERSQMSRGNISQTHCRSSHHAGAVQSQISTKTQPYTK